MITVIPEIDLFGKTHFHIKVSDSKGNHAEVYKDVQTMKKPRGMCPGYWNFLLNTAFTQFAAITTHKGSFKGRRWDVEKGVKHTDVLTYQDIILILSGQLIYDKLTGVRSEKIWPPEWKEMRRENS